MDLEDSARASLPEGKGPALEEPEQAAKRQPALVGDGQGSLLDGGDGPIGVEGDGEEGNFPSVLSKKKNKDSFTKLSLSAAIVLMLAATGWLLYKKVLAPPPKPPLPAVTETDKEIELYSKKLVEMRDVLDDAWSMASNTVKKAFTSNYMPSTDRAHVPASQALSYYKLQVLEMLELPQPAAHDDIREKKDYLYKLQMLTSVLDAAARRLDALRTLEANAELPAFILGRMSGAREVQPSGNVDFNAFLENLAERGLRYTRVRGLPQSKQTVPSAKALELLDLLTMEEKMIISDRNVQAAFEHFLGGQGLSLKTLQDKDATKVAVIKLPRDPTAMDTRVFVRYLHSRHSSVEAQKFTGDLLDYLAANWSEEAVSRATQQFKEHHEGDLKDNLKQKKEMLSNAIQLDPPVPLTHCFPLAVFLL